MIWEEAQLIAIIPWLPRRGWFPLVLQLLVDLTMLLPEVNGLLFDPDEVAHPYLHGFHLAAWRLSGDLSIGEAFRERLLPPHVQLIDNQRAISTAPSGSSFLPGVLKGATDPLHPSIRTVLAYLQHLPRLGLKHATILNHISALSSCSCWEAPFFWWLGESLVTDRSIRPSVPWFLFGICCWSWWLSLKNLMNLYVWLLPDCCLPPCRCLCPLGL